MKLLFPLLAISTSTIHASSTDLTKSAQISIQPLTSPSTTVPLASITYNPTLLTATLTSFDFDPSLLPSSSSLLRIGLYDPTTLTWKSSTSLTSSETFDKGYRPTLVLSLDIKGNVLGVSCKSERMDAGQTRDFRPKVVVVKAGRGKEPELNRPVVLSKEGKMEEEVVEKTLLQKYWWVALGVLMLVMTAGGGGE